MGGGVVVGILADADEEAQTDYLAQFEAINEILQSNGLSRHVEPGPDEMDWNEVFSCGLSSGEIHYLRRIAAHRALGKPTPSPGNRESYKDPTLAEYFERFQARENLRYQHLIMHSDVDGYYIPVDFERPIATPPFGWLGSTQQLQAECADLASALDVPISMHHESDKLSKAVFAQERPKGEFLRRFWPSRAAQTAIWKKYAVETHVCLCLLAACRISLQAKAAIEFSP
jgi:hypothetical protein